MRSSGLGKFLNDKKSVNSRIKSVGKSKTATKFDKSIGYVRRMVIDSGNPRYAASKHSSFLGGLTTGQHVRNRFKIPVDAYKPITRTAVDDELFGAEGTMYNTLNCTTKDFANMTEEDDDGILRHDEMLYNDQEDKFYSKTRIGSREPMRDADLDTTSVATSAVYPMIEDAGSSVPTAFYTQKISDYSKRL